MYLFVKTSALQNSSTSIIFDPVQFCPIITHNQDQVEAYCHRTDLFKHYFFPYTIAEWNKLDITLRNAKSYLIFRNSLLKIGRPIQNSIF